MARPGRPQGSGNVPTLEKIRLNRAKLEKMLLEKALAGDIQAMALCLQLLDEAERESKARRRGHKTAPSTFSESAA